MISKSFLHDKHAAALAHAVAIRALHSYRAARDRAIARGLDASALIEPPGFDTLGDEYERVVEGYVDEPVESTNVARCALDLLAAIALDHEGQDIFDEGGPVSIERDRNDTLRLISSLSGWVNRHDIDEAIAEERRGRLVPEPQPLVPTPPLDESEKTELRQRCEAIAAEFGGPLPPETDAGLIEAERRLSGLRQARCGLHKAMAWDFKAGEEIVNPLLGTPEDALLDFISDTPPQGLSGIVVKLREILFGAPTDEDELRQILAVVEREYAARTES